MHPHSEAIVIAMPEIQSLLQQLPALEARVVTLRGLL